MSNGYTTIVIDEVDRWDRWIEEVPGADNRKNAALLNNLKQERGEFQTGLREW